jgi:hypothetical protein
MLCYNSNGDGRMKKLRKLLYFLIFSFMVGFFYTMLVYHGLWQKLMFGLSDIHFFSVVFIFILMFYLTLTLHELGHFLSFKQQGVKMRAIYLTIFVFYKTDKGWRFTIKPKLWVLLGGLVVPDLDIIDSELSYDETVNKFANSLKFAPIVTIVFAILSFILFITFFIFSPNAALIGHLFYMVTFILLLSALYTFTFFLHNDQFYGDFVAYKKIKEDEVFKLIQINQYLMFSLQNHQISYDFLWAKVIHHLKQIPNFYQIFQMMLLNIYLEGVIYDDRPIDIEIDFKIQHINLHRLIYKEQGLQTAHDITLYHYKKHDVQKAYDLFDELKQKSPKRLPEKLRNYLIKKSEHLMHLDDHHNYLSDMKNVYIGQYWIFEALIDINDMTKSAHQPLPYVEFSSSIAYIYNVEEQDLHIQKSDFE